MAEPTPASPGPDLRWSREARPVWDAAKARIVGGAPAGSLAVDHAAERADGADLPGDWFVATDRSETVVGVGWLDVTWGGDAEVTLAVDPAHQGAGVGSFVMEHLEAEALARGVNYVYNTVPDGHPDREAVHDWLLVRGYEGNESDAALRKRVGGAGMGAAAADAREPATRHTGQGSMVGSRPPGHEESGGYVDVEDHRF